MSIDLSRVDQRHIVDELPTNTSPWNEGNISKCLSNLSFNEANVDEIQIQETLITINKTQQLKTKLKQLHQWRIEKVYDKVNGIVQPSISPRWVLKDQIINVRKAFKARLCPIVFKEEQDFRVGSPTFSKEVFPFPGCIILSN